MTARNPPVIDALRLRRRTFRLGSKYLLDRNRYDLEKKHCS
jgi:hypothetical protein